MKKTKKTKDYRNLPYFETKVVKVKCKPVVSSKEWTPDYCPCCGQRTIVEKKGNWVNGENLDKIKWPSVCSYRDGLVIKHGQLNKGFFRGKYYYFITDESMQYKDANCEQFYVNLKKLIDDYDIHIRKGKIIIFEEDK